MEKKIKLICNDITKVSVLSLEDIKEIINIANKYYFASSKTIISDEIYDILVNILEKII